MISVVIPVFNEEGSVAKLHEEIVSAMTKIGRPFEIIFVDDGSSDKTVSILKNLSPIRLIRFRKNFGQTAALDAGIKASRGEYIVTLDGDGQNDPAEIPKLIAELEMKDLDVVSGWRKNRQDSFSKKYASRLAAYVRKFLINDGIHDSGCTLKIYRKECFDHVDLYGEMHRFIPAILKIKGFTVGEVVVAHRERGTGITKYTWKRGIRGILDMISVWFWKKYANRPLHLFGSFGALLIVISVVALGIAIYEKAVHHIDLSNTAWTMFAMFGFFIGIQMTISGLMADIMSKNYFASTRDKSYVIKEEIEKK
jgi:glycosyltransferase involved in cell wall biosynthesis